jgi:hypothetical protein
MSPLPSAGCGNSRSRIYAIESDSAVDPVVRTA